MDRVHQRMSARTRLSRPGLFKRRATDVGIINDWQRGQSRHHRHTKLCGQTSSHCWPRWHRWIVNLSFSNVGCHTLLLVILAWRSECGTAFGVKCFGENLLIVFDKRRVSHITKAFCRNVIHMIVATPFNIVLVVSGPGDTMVFCQLPIGFQVRIGSLAPSPHRG